MIATTYRYKFTIKFSYYSFILLLLAYLLYIHTFQIDVCYCQQSMGFSGEKKKTKYEYHKPNAVPDIGAWLAEHYVEAYWLGNKAGWLPNQIGGRSTQSDNRNNHNRNLIEKIIILSTNNTPELYKF